jgi:hypothetical protein
MTYFPAAPHIHHFHALPFREPASYTNSSFVWIHLLEKVCWELHKEPGMLVCGCHKCQEMRSETLDAFYDAAP